MERELNPYAAPRSAPAEVPRATQSAAPLGDAPIAIFHLLSGEAWKAQGFDRFWQTFTPSPIVLVAIFVSISGIVSALVFADPADLFTIGQKALISVFGITLVSAVVFATFWAIKQAYWGITLNSLRADQDYNAAIIVTLYREGFVIVGRSITTIMKWNCLERVSRFPDGIVLVFIGAIHLWLPLAEMTQGHIDLIDQALRAKVSKYKSFR
jgi:hypothetical protein